MLVGRNTVLIALLLVSFPLPLTGQTLPSFTLDGTVYEATEIDQAEAEQLFASAEAAVYFPEARRIRWLAAGSAFNPRIGGRISTVEEFRQELERDFPGFRWNSHGEYLLKLPSKAVPVSFVSSEKTSAVVAPSATVFTDSFENGLSQWVLGNNSGGSYNFTTMGCATHTGSWSADAIRGGSAGQYLFCWDGYPPSTVTQITHNACDSIQGASQAWVDFYFTADMDSSEYLGVYYLGPDDYLWGYSFTGSWTGWYHAVVNPKQWHKLGDLTTWPCAKLIFQFGSDATSTAGTGPQLDDVTIRTDAPPFLRCAISASPLSGPAPLTVNFAPTVAGASGSETYEWRFGDAAGSTSNSRNATFTYAAQGDYWVRLRVVDSNNVRGYASVKIQVTSPSTCSLGCSATAPSAATAGSPASFTANASPSGCTGTPSYAWTFGDGQSSSSQNASHVYSTPGSYSWTMTVSVGGTSCTRQGTISVGAAGKGRRRAVDRPPVSPAGLDVVVSPSATAQTMAYEGCSLTIPGGLLTGAQRLTIARTSGAPSPNYQGLQQMAAYDIRLGDLHNLPGEVTIRMKYDPAAIRTDIPIERAVSASWWNPDQSAWVTLPSTVDTAAREIVVRTRHLSLFSWTMVKLGYGVFFKNHFYIVYDKAEVTDPNFLRWYRNPDTSNYADASVPNYVEDVMAFLIDAYRKYVDEGKFSAPPTPIDVYVGTNLSSFSEKITGIILISLLPQTPEQLKLVTAHELFHRVQNAYYYDIGGMLWLKWWLEATADYAGDRYAWGGLGQMGRKISYNYLEAPLTDAGPAHDEGYSTSHFVKFLVDGGANFKAMWDATANPDWFDSFSFLDGLTTYLMKVHGQDQGLSRQYQKFARWYVFDANSPMPAIDDSLHSQVAAYRSTLQTGKGEAVTFDLRGGYTAKLWGIWFGEPLFDASTTKLKYTVALDGTLPTKVEADVYVLKGDKRVAGGQAPVGTLSQTVKKVEVEVEKGDAVYVLAVNADSSAHQVKVRIGTEEWKCHAVYWVATYKEASGSGYVLCTGNCRPYDGSVSEIFLGEVQDNRYFSDTMWCPQPPMYCRWGPGGVSSFDNEMEFRFTGTNGEAIEGFRLETSFNGPYGDILSVAGAVPRLSSSATAFQYKLTGAGVCSAVSFTRKVQPVYDIVCDGSSYFLLSCETNTGP